MAGKINSFRNWIRLFILCLIISDSGHSLFAQGISYNYFYRVYFKDKGSSVPTDYSAVNLLSQRAINRRVKAFIPVPVFTDLPVNKTYLDQIISKGFVLHCTSKWMNTGLFKTQNLEDINQILNLSFVKDVKIVKRPVAKSSYSDKLDFTTRTASAFPYDRPITMLNGQSLHNSGYDGTGILIAILDGGFVNADNISSLIGLRSRGGIKGTRDIILKGTNVFGYHYHGTAVLSILAGKISGIIEGTAPGADYWLIRTEDVSSEFPVEEDFWAAGAEYADSVGADIISSSLGYYNFDDPTLNYKFADMNGNTAFVTRAADFAASKGILVVNSAGNERTNPWLRIIAPSDGDSVLAAAAVDGNGVISSFSSAGPSASGQIKPDNAAQGVDVTIQISGSSVVLGSGTSFSCPVLSGMCACVKQAVPKALNVNIIEALHKNGDRYNHPDSLYGYGIPNMIGVLTTLHDQYPTEPDNETTIGPNPFTSDLQVTFKNPPQTLKIIISNSSGQTIAIRSFKDYLSNILRIPDLQNKPQGIYFIKIVTSRGSFSHKVIKINN